MIVQTSANLKKKERKFVEANLVVSTWQAIEPYFATLQNASINNVSELKIWLANLAELQAVISEDACWRQINMTRDTTNANLEQAYIYWCTEIQPAISTATNTLYKKLLACTYTAELDALNFGIFLRTVKKDVELFAEANVPLLSEESILAQQYGTISAQMTIDVQGQTYTLQQAVKFLMQSNRALRKEVYDKIAARRLQDKDALNTLFDKLLNLRQQIASNAGFSNYRDYKFKELSRFDYTVQDCENFATAVQKYIVPLCNKIYEYKKTKLGLTELMPYDVEAEPAGVQPLQPFENGKELTAKSIQVFNKLHSYFGGCLQTMQSMQHLDLDSRQGKAPGGYNCPLAETGVPFIFMNAAGTADDVVTMMHEGGHAVHSFLCHNLEYSFQQDYPIEIAELASMSMELFTMDYWDEFYTNADELIRAKAEELERVLTVLPWIAIIDKFQHWLYTNAGHSIAAREQAWNSIQQEFSVQVINYTDYEMYRTNFWQKQLHLFEVPFYYIEYGIAQLGAIGMWQQYKQDKQKALDNYTSALALGGTLSLNKLYEKAGLSLNFNEDKIKELSSFVNMEMEKYIL
jgi:oligoendopeptidase F